MLDNSLKDGAGVIFVDENGRGAGREAEKAARAMTQFVLCELLAVIDAHAARATEMSDRIAELEVANNAIEEENQRLRDGAQSMMPRIAAAEQKAQAAAEEADQVEAAAESHRRGAEFLSEKLASAGEDLDRLAGAISRLLLQQ